MPLTETRISYPSQRTFSAKMHRKANGGRDGGAQCLDSKFYQMERVLRKTLRVMLDDGRVVKGQFQVGEQDELNGSVSTLRST